MIRADHPGCSRCWSLLILLEDAYPKGTSWRSGYTYFRIGGHGLRVRSLGPLTGLLFEWGAYRRDHLLLKELTRDNRRA